MEGDVRVPALEAREQHDCKWRARVLPSLWLTRDQMTFPIVASPIDNTSISESEVIHVTPLRDGVASPWVQVGQEKHFRVRLHLRVFGIAEDNRQDQVRVHAALRVRPVRRLKRASQRQSVAQQIKSTPHRSSVNEDSPEPSARTKRGARPERTRRLKSRTVNESQPTPVDADASNLGASRSTICAEDESFESTSDGRAYSDFGHGDHSNMLYHTFSSAALRSVHQPNLMPSNFVSSLPHAAQLTPAGQLLTPALAAHFSRAASAFSPFHTSFVRSMPHAQSVGAGCCLGPGWANLYAAPALGPNACPPNQAAQFQSGCYLPPASYPVPSNMAGAVPMSLAQLQYLVALRSQLM
mmetsp:Transcript_15929/g.36293  ORF Transcript_15929/g.36293 Transcript_15929/m.36293 type:complete len:354 (+) Transcript_15929:18-1079(+)